MLNFITAQLNIPTILIPSPPIQVILTLPQHLPIARGRAAPRRDRKCRSALAASSACSRRSFRRRRRRFPGRISRPHLPAASPGSAPVPLRSRLAATAIMNKKKKPFLGMPAPLGYVPGLGRG